MTLVLLSVGTSLLNSPVVRFGIRKLRRKLSKYERAKLRGPYNRPWNEFRVSLVVRYVEFDSMIKNSNVRSAILIAHKGYHVPAVRRRDRFYAKLEDQRLERTSA